MHYGISNCLQNRLNLSIYTEVEKKKSQIPKTDHIFVTPTLSHSSYAHKADTLFILGLGKLPSYIIHIPTVRHFLK